MIFKIDYISRLDIAMLYYRGVALVLYYGGVLESAIVPRIWVL